MARDWHDRALLLRCGSALAVGMALLAPQPAVAVIELQPFESFVCGGDTCAPDFVRTGGDGGQVTGRVLRSRSTGAFLQTDEDEAEAGIRFRVCAPTVATISVNGSYQGLLRGTGGGIVNRGLMDIELILRDVTGGTVVERRLIAREEERGDSPATTVNAPVSSFFDFGEGPDGGATIEVELEADRVFSAGLVLQTEASGVNALADFRNGFRQAVLTSVSIQLEPDLPDSDGDGLFDVWETEGLRDCEGNVLVDLPDMGADPNRKDIFVEYDWLPGREPTKEGLELVKARFADAPVDGGEGVRLWIDTGDLTEAGLEEQGGGFGSCLNGADDDGDTLIDIDDPDCLVGDNLGGGNEIPLIDVPNGRNIPRIAGDADGNDIADFREVKDENFDSARRPIFHYAIQGPPGTREGDVFGGCEDEMDNDGDMLIDDEDELDCFNRSQAGSGANFILLNDTPSTFMHELGHSLGLGHGGRLPDGSDKDITNCKPNYVSIMNYLFPGGVPADRDGDGVFEDLTIDFSPLRTTDDRAAAPLDDLDEGDLDETVPLDPTDPLHATRFTDATGIGRTSAVDEGLNWDGVGGTDATGVVANIDGGDEDGLPEDCAQQSATDADPDGEVLAGHNDWANLVYRFLPDTPLEGGPIEPILEPPLDTEAVELAFNATDLAITKGIDRPFWVGGQEVLYTLSVTNLGPNGARQPRVRDMPPLGAVFVDPPENCALEPTGALVCELPPLAVDATAELELRVRLPLVLDCGAEQTTRLFNSASVENPFGREIDTSNNAVRLEHEALCPRFEYPAKLVCGEQPDEGELAFRRGAYGTSINVHNPQDEEVYVFLKLAQARPPRDLEPGPVLPIDLVAFAYDEAFVVDCDVVAQRLFDGALPAALLDGFLVMQTAREVDVRAVYTTASLDSDGKLGAHSSIDVENVAKRRLRPPPGRPDLVAEPQALDVVCDVGVCRVALRYRLANIGAADASAFGATTSLEPGALAADTVPVPGGLAAGAERLDNVELQILQADLDDAEQICVGADLPADAVIEDDETNNTGCLGLP